MRTDKVAVKAAVLAVEIPRDELAVRIAIACTQMRPKAGLSASDALDEMNGVGIIPGMTRAMGDTFRDAADAAVLYLRECITAGAQPS